MMGLALIAAVVLGWLAGGSLHNLLHLPLLRFECITAAFAIQAALLVGPTIGWTPVVRWGFALHILSYLLLLYALYENRKLPGIPLISAGVAANFLVIAANRGMPVCPDALRLAGRAYLTGALESGEYVMHRLMTEDVTLAVLTDYIVLPSWRGGGVVVSPGDILMVGGLMWLMVRAMSDTGRVPAEGEEMRVEEEVEAETRD